MILFSIFVSVIVVVVELGIAVDVVVIVAAFGVYFIYGFLDVVFAFFLSDFSFSLSSHYNHMMMVHIHL